ncbi:hypothetical protein [Paracoccus sp. (in: a-proteobacteria)]|uniref:hypothetical protein n=1 Tax=Paracoccus sp. TaxID=267 RepID=UPI002AFE2269|nr:hypothetical protein [Paracoccus sp. (in: a-proteobacteria)]
MSYHVEALCDRHKFGSATRKQIAMYLANKASDDGTGIWCSKYTIARHTELSLATVKRTISDFLSEGLLIATGFRKTSVHGQTVVYRIMLERVKELEPLAWGKTASLTEVTVNPVQEMSSTGLTVSPPPGSGCTPNNPRNYPLTPPPARLEALAADDAGLAPIWDAYPADRRRDRLTCQKNLAVALSEASVHELTLAAKAYASETAEYTRRTVMFLDNWLRTGKWRRYVDEQRQQLRSASELAKAGEEALVQNAAKWIGQSSGMCQHVLPRHAHLAVERGLITRYQAQKAGVLP